MAYKIQFAASSKSQLGALSGSQRARILNAIETQLKYEPLVET